MDRHKKRVEAWVDGTQWDLSNQTHQVKEFGSPVSSLRTTAIAVRRLRMDVQSKQYTYGICQHTDKVRPSPNTFSNRNYLPLAIRVNFRI